MCLVMAMWKNQLISRWPKVGLNQWLILNVIRSFKNKLPYHLKLQNLDSLLDLIMFMP